MKPVLLIFSTFLLACNPPEPTVQPNKNDDYKKMYEHSIRIKDFNSAIAAIQLILVNDSNNPLRDSLPELYGVVNNLHSCLITTEASLKKYPKDEKFKNLKVLCLQQTGDLDGQMVLLKDLYESTGKAQYISQIASMQIGTGNLKDASETIDLILSRYKESTDSLDIFLDETNKQKVPVNAAAWNMKGYIYMQQKEIESAKEAYFKALEIFPDFVMPKRNLESIFSRKAEKPEKKKKKH